MDRACRRLLHGAGTMVGEIGSRARDVPDDQVEEIIAEAFERVRERHGASHQAILNL